jgi:hypothetical protein
MLDDGVSATIEELAKREKVNRGYMCAVLRLTLLAPDLVETVLDGRHGPEMTLGRLLEGFELAWDDQRRALTAWS